MDDSLLNDPESNSLDPFFIDNSSLWNFNLGYGFYLRTEDWYLGFSAPRILTNDNNANSGYQSLERVTYYFNGGYIFKLSSQVKFKPTFLIKYTNGAPISIDGTVNFLLNEKVALGILYRHIDAIGAMAMINVTKNLKLGYAYDFTTSQLLGYSFVSHELLITYDIKLKDESCGCPDWN